MKKKILILIAISVASSAIISGILFLGNVSKADIVAVYENCIPLSITETSNIARVKEPITSGVPLKANTVFSTANLRVLDSAYQEIPAQFKVLSRWGALNDSSKSIKWVLVDFQADIQAGAKNSYYLEYGTVHSNFGSNIVSETAQNISFTTGKISFDLSKSKFSLFDKIFSNGVQITDTSSDNGIFAIEYESNKIYGSNLEAPMEIDIEENGPLKAVVQMQGAMKTQSGEYLGKDASDNARLSQPYPYVHYNIRLTVYKNKDYVKTQFIFENDGAGGMWPENKYTTNQHIYVEDLRLKTNLNFDNPSFYTVDSQYFGNNITLETRGQWADVQDTFPYNLNVDGTISETGVKYPGWVEISKDQKNVAFGMKYFWQKHPVNITYDNGFLEIGVMPEGEGYPLDMNDYYVFDGGRHYGVELLYRFSSGARDRQETLRSMALLNDPLFAFVADTDYYAETGGWTRLAPSYVEVSDPVQKEAIERYEKLALAQADINYAEPTEGWRRPANTVSSTRGDSAKWFGNLNFGDIMWAKNYSSLSWDWTQGMLLHMLRHGNTELWKQAQEFIPHKRDVDQYWGDRTDSQGGHVFINHLSRYEADGHNRPGFDAGYGYNPSPAPSHNWNGGLALSYLLTGDEESLEAAEESYLFAYGKYKNKIENPSFGIYGCELRWESWPMLSVLNLYKIRGEQKYLDLALALGKSLLLGEQQAGGNGLWEGPDNLNPSSSCGDTVMQNVMFGFVADGLVDLYEESRDEEIGSLLVRMAEYATNTIIYGGEYNSDGRYKPLQLDYNYTGIENRTNNSNTAWDYLFTDLIAEAYKITGDTKYLDFSRQLFKDVSFYYYGGNGNEYIDPATRNPAVFADNVYNSTWNKVKGWMLRAHQVYLNLEAQLLESPMSSCASQGGNICSSDYSCNAGSFVFSSDSAHCCLGTCMLTSQDTQAPQLSNGEPSSFLAADTTNITMSLATNENAICKYSKSANTLYAYMSNTFSTTGEITHSTLITDLENGATYTYYIKCIDANNNANSSDYLISFYVSSSSAFRSDTAEGVVGKWRLDGNTNDLSGNNHSGSVTGTSLWDTGKIGDAFKFDGSSYITVPDSSDLDNTNKLTVSFWVYPTLLDGLPRGLVSKRYDVSYSVFFWSNNKLYVDINDTNHRFSTNKIFKTNRWYFLTVVYDGTFAETSQRVKVYVDGDLDITASEYSTSISDRNAPLYFGILNEGYATAFKGKMDEIEIRKEALTAEEVEDLFLGDTVAPEISGGLPTGALASLPVNMTVITDENATCKHSTTAGKNYLAMKNTFSATGEKKHSSVLNDLEDGSYNYYIKCSDSNNNINSEDYIISFVLAKDSVDKIAPIGVIKVKDNLELTNDNIINLELSAEDSSGVEEMKISEKNKFEQVEAESFKTTKSFIVTLKNGLKTIYAWFKDALGNWNIEPHSATITLDTEATDIKNVVIENITETTAQINWTTNENTKTFLEYGLTNNYGEEAISGEFFVKENSVSIENLSENTTYHFRVVAQDEAGNISQSIDYELKTLEGEKGADTVPPAKIEDLTAQNITQTSLELLWTATGDDGENGLASSYDIRYFQGNLTEGNWKNAEEVSGEPIPSKAGIAESAYITVGLEPGKTYTFGIKTKDEANNWSEISNIIEVKTQPLTLTVLINAEPSEGKEELSGVSLSANIEGTATGDINYYFYCDWKEEKKKDEYIHKAEGTTETSYSAENICNYSSNGNYKARVLVERGGITAENYIIIKVKQKTVNSGGGGGSSSGGGGGSIAGGGLYRDTTPPAQPSRFKATPAQKQIILTWVNPKDADFVRVKILRKTNSAPQSINDQDAQLIYEGEKEEYTDINLINGTTYYYSIFAYDKKPNYSKALTISAVPIAGQNTVTKPANNIENKYKGIKHLYGLAKEIVELISGEESEVVFGHNQFVNLTEKAKEIYTKVVGDNADKLEIENEYSIAKFIQDGTETTIRLGSGERAGVINSYISAFKKYPQASLDWQDIIKIANGRWPNERNQEKEDEAKNEIFKKIYKREPNMNNANDNAAVTIITYGLRPVNRNLESEKAGILTFKAIFGVYPADAIDWDTVRAIAYSGSKR